MTESYSGEETFADILKIVLECDFSSDEINQHGATASIIHQENIPFLKFQAQVKATGEFVGYYQLDQIMARVFSECERLCDDFHKRGLFGQADKKAVQQTKLHVARYAMNMALRRTMLLQLTMFEDNFNETMFLTSGLLLKAISTAHEAHPKSEDISKAATKGVRTFLDETLDLTIKLKRRLLADLLNTVGSLRIPIGVGRPKGTTKPKSKKVQDALTFEREVEQTIRYLLSAKGAMPTKTEVAKQIGIGGINPKKLTDSSLTAFRNKLKRLGLDYEAIVERVMTNK